MDGQQPAQSFGMQRACCPRCLASVPLQRSAWPPIDACGFESYRLICCRCGAESAVIVDPADDGLLVTEVTTTLGEPADIDPHPPNGADNPISR